MTNHHVSLLVMIIAKLAMSVGIVTTVIAGEDRSTCDIAISEKQCGPPSISEDWGLLEIADFAVLFAGSLSPKHASIDESSMSLVFRLNENQLLIINRHNTIDNRWKSFMTKINSIDNLREGGCVGDDVSALRCLLIGEGEHIARTDDRFSDVLYFESESVLHGNISRAFVFDETGDGYYDIVFSPAADCSSVGFSGSLGDASLKERIEAQHRKATRLLETFVRTDNVDPRLVEGAGFDLMGESSAN